MSDPHSTIFLRRCFYGITTLLPGFLRHAQVEHGFSNQSLEKYEGVLRQVARKFGNPDVRNIRKGDVLDLRADMMAQGRSDSWQACVCLILRRFLVYAKDELGLDVMDPKEIKPPVRKHRAVLFLTPEEVERFVGAIPLETARSRPNLRGLRFRALVEVLLGTGMRIGEVLSLDISAVDFEAREAKIIGKGGRERICFFTQRSLYYLALYLKARTDSCPALFATQGGRGRLKRPDIWREFARYRKLARLEKPVRPHVLRHTTATWLLFNGCPVGHIKEILGHARLETTCRYYLGLDNRAAKAAHEKYMV